MSQRNKTLLIALFFLISISNCKEFIEYTLGEKQFFCLDESKKTVKLHFALDEIDSSADLIFFVSWFLIE